MKRITVLGSGMVGSVIATDMASDPGHLVTIVDASKVNLAAAAQRAARLGVPLATVEADCSSAAEIKRVIADADMVAGALASRLAFAALKTIIEAGKHFADIAFMGEDALELDGLAKAKGVTAVVDCGVAPGMSHILAARGAAELDVCEAVEMYVGGLPAERRWPFEYKSGFSPADVLEEYTRPARLVEGHAVVTRPALSEPELMEFAGVGTLEAFNTDGLRSMARTYLGKIPHMKEKTLRYPGHIELMRVFRETGLMDESPVTVGGVSVRPRDLLAKLMFPMWTYQPGEADLTVMRVIAAGLRGGKAAKVQYDVHDRYDPVTGTTSMARTTAFPCAIMARRVMNGQFTRRGVITPEFIGESGAETEHLLAEQSRRGVLYHKSVV